MFKRCLITLVLALFATMLVTACGQEPAKKPAQKTEAAKKADDAAKKADATVKKAEDAAAAAKDAAKDAAAAAKEAAGAAKEAAKKPVQGIPLPDNF